tara:strand:+ start:130 stop:723 length:594 start_codon:yes stop_codon:yes gene_type:complete
MVSIIIIEKTGELKNIKYDATKDELYKKCKFKKDDNFLERHTWKTKKDKYDFKTVTLYARDTGKANTENKYDLPPPVDNFLYFGCCALVAKNNDDEYVDLDVEMWEKFYEDLFGGFENLTDTVKEDEEEEDELDNIPDNMKTKSGYLKDDFIVDDNEIVNEDGEIVIEGENISDGEEEWDDNTSELEYDDYTYSDED